MDSDIENDDHSDHSLYIKNIPLEIRVRNEWWELKHSELNYNGTNKIGSGSAGDVYKINWRGIDVVVKCLKKNVKNYEEQAYKDLLNEISIISHLRHPNLLLFLGACTINEPILLVYEYLNKGTLENYYRSNLKYNNYWKPKKNLIQMWLLELTRAVYFLHNCYYPIMHRDIKPSNILLTDSLHLKLSDFGLSKLLVKNPENYKMSECTGTFRYMAPEIMESKDYDLKIDIYSLSLNMWFICSCVRPYIELEKLEDKMMYRMILYNSYRPDIKKISWLKEPKLNELITQMWDKDPDLRPDIKHVLKIIESNNIKNTDYCIIQ